MTSILNGREFIIPTNSHGSVKFQTQLAKRMEKKGASVLLLPQTKEYQRELEDNIPDRFILNENINHKPTRELPDLLEKYSIDSSRSLVFPQMVYDYKYLKPSGGRFLPNGPVSPKYKKYLDRLHVLLDYLDKLYEDGFCGIPIQNQGGEINRRVLARVTKYHGIPSIRCSFNPLQGRKTIRSGEEMSLKPINTAFEQDLTPEQRERAENYRRTVIRDKPQIGSSTSQSQSTSLKSDISGKIQTIIEKRSDSLPLINDWLRRTIGKPVQAKVQQNWSLNRTDTTEHIQNTNFIFYSIQYFRESRVTMRAPAFYDQAGFIEFLSRSVPHNTNLVVKDHPQQLGAMPFFDIRRISRYATLADPSYSAHEIIENADAVVTLNNTVGHEAIVFGKPVVVLGSALYSGLDSVVSPDDINELDTAISEAIDKGGLTNKQVLQYIDALYRVSEPVIWADPTPKNISSFISAIESRLSRDNV